MSTTLRGTWRRGMVHFRDGFLGHFRRRPASGTRRARTAGRPHGCAAPSGPHGAAGAGDPAALLACARRRSGCGPQHGCRRLRRTGGRGLADRPAGVGDPRGPADRTARGAEAGRCPAAAAERAHVQPPAGSARPRVVPAHGVAQGVAEGADRRAPRSVRLRRPARRLRAADRAGRLSGAGARCPRRPGPHRGLRRVRPRDDADGEGAAGEAGTGRGRRVVRARPALEPARRRRSAHEGPAAGRVRLTHVRAGAGGRGADDTGAPVPDGRPAPPGPAHGCRRLGQNHGRGDSGGRLRRGVPLRPATRRGAAGTGSRAGRLLRNGQQVHRSRAAARLAGAPRSDGGGGGAGEGQLRLDVQLAGAADAGRVHRLRCVRPACPLDAAALPAAARPAGGGPGRTGARHQGVRDRGRAARRTGTPPGTEQSVVQAAAWQGLALDGGSQFRHADVRDGRDMLVVGYGTPSDSAWAGTLEALCRVLP